MVRPWATFHPCVKFNQNLFIMVLAYTAQMIQNAKEKPDHQQNQTTSFLGDVQPLQKMAEAQ